MSQRVALLLFILVVTTGTLKTIVTQVTLNAAFVHPNSMMLVAANYVGQYGFGAWMQYQAARTRSSYSPYMSPSPSSSSSSSSSTRFYLIVISLLDVLGGACAMLATIHIGSGLYQILYSSFLVITALLSYLILGTRLTWYRIVCIVIITYGLLIASQSVPQHDINMSYHAIAGITTTMICTISYAIQSVVCELMNGRDGISKVSASEMNRSIGAYGSIATLMYILLYTVPQWYIMITQPMHTSGLTLSGVVCLFIIYLLFNVGHRFTYWYVVDKIGSIACGVANAVRTVCVFLFSALLFCDTTISSTTPSDMTTPQSLQCMTSYKLASCVIIMIGTIAYTLAPDTTKTTTINTTMTSHDTHTHAPEAVPLVNMSSTVRSRVSTGTPPHPPPPPE